jgi:predicted transcriptional regulator of viral defense system
MKKDPSQQVIDLARRTVLLRSCDLDAYRIPRTYLSRLARSKQLIRVGRGLYALPDSNFGEHQSLVEVARRAPRAVVCLLSALRFHEITTQSPFEVWIAIDNKARAPKLKYPTLRVVRYSGAALTKGIEEHDARGITLRVYSVAKTVADCFKFRNKIGLEVALEALRESWRAKRVTMDDLWRYAKVCRVTNVMRPYLESLE